MWGCVLSLAVIHVPVLLRCRDFEISLERVLQRGTSHTFGVTLAGEFLGAAVIYGAVFWVALQVIYRSSWGGAPEQKR